MHACRKDTANSPDGTVYILDFPELAELVCDRKPDVQLIVQSVDSVKKVTIRPWLQENGVRTLREAAGVPVSVVAEGELRRGPKLKGLLEHWSRPETLDAMRAAKKSGQSSKLSRRWP